MIISGMHRSGTSAMARLVQGLGADLGSDLLPAAGGNIHGHFEEGAFIRFHDQLIERQFPHRAPFCEWLPLADHDVVYTDDDRAQAKLIWDAHRAKGGNAWKDPRTSLFLDLWLDVVPDAKVMVCLRHPYQVHRSLLRRGEPLLHIDYSAAILGWTVYNQRLLRTISALPKDRFTVIDVEASFREPQRLTESVAQFLGLPLAEKAVEAIDPGAFHFEDDARESLDPFETFFPETGTLYRQLRQFDLLHPVPLPAASKGTESAIRSQEARLIEFEETQGLRAKARKMLIRSIAVDRQRVADYYKQLARIEAEKDRLIEDLSRLTDGLKRRVGELEAKREKSSN